MRFIVLHSVGDYGVTFCTSSDGRDRDGWSEDIKAAYRFDTFSEAYAASFEFQGVVVAMDEPRWWHSLNQAAQAVEDLRTELLFGGGDPESEISHNLPRYAEQHFLAALSHLDVAMRELKLGWFDQMQPK